MRAEGAARGAGRLASGSARVARVPRLVHGARDAAAAAAWLGGTLAPALLDVGRAGVWGAGDGARAAARGRSVCIVTQAPGFGGTEVHTIGLLRLLLDRGCDVHLISCRHHEYDRRIPPDILGRIRMSHTDLGMNDRGPRASLQWRALLGREGGILIVPKGGNGVGNLGFLAACRRVFDRIYLVEHLEAPPARPAVTWPRPGLPRVSLPAWRRRISARLRAAMADRVIAVSAAVADRLRRNDGLASAVVTNGVPWRDFVRDPARGSAVRAHHAIPHDSFLFGMVTRLVEDKGIDLAIEAMRHVLRTPTPRRPHLLVAGAGPLEAPLKAQAERLGIAASLSFVGFVPDARDVLSSFDAILFPSRAEGLPLALLEGMAAGCLPIVTDVGGMPEVVSAPAIGWVVPRSSPEALSEAMASAAALHPDEIEARRTRVAARVRDHFDIAATHRKLIDLLAL